jgi:hypothetical protein
MFVQLMGEEIFPSRIAEEMKKSKLVMVGKNNGEKNTYVACDVSSEKFHLETLQGESVSLDIKKGHGIWSIIFLDLDDAIDEIRNLTREKDELVEASKELSRSFSAWRRAINIK